LVVAHSPVEGAGVPPASTPPGPAPPLEFELEEPEELDEEPVGGGLSRLLLGELPWVSSSSSASSAFFDFFFFFDFDSDSRGGGSLKDGELQAEPTAMEDAMIVGKRA
jgi:hypothetical protein